MQSGRVVFDGTPAELTAARVREIYGVGEAEFEAQAVATALPSSRPDRRAAVPVAA
jgi:phosphonate transport system ATP-binding protein